MQDLRLNLESSFSTSYQADGVRNSMDVDVEYHVKT